MTRQSWPAAWLFTDERLGNALGSTLARAAEAGAGVVVRQHRSDPALRRRTAEEVLSLGLTLGISRDVALAEALGAAFVHNPAGRTALPLSLSVHDEAEAMRAAERSPALVFISPIFATRSHPGAPVLGIDRAIQLMTLARCPAVALGGMDRERGAMMMERGFAGWAGIDCWL